jgi:hypothetical protein
MKSDYEPKNRWLRKSLSGLFCHSLSLGVPSSKSNSRYLSAPRGEYEILGLLICPCPVATAALRRQNWLSRHYIPRPHNCKSVCAPKKPGVPGKVVSNFIGAIEMTCKRQPSDCTMCAQSGKTRFFEVLYPQHAKNRGIPRRNRAVSFNMAPA